jgi:hypothetical protein
MDKSTDQRLSPQAFIVLFLTAVVLFVGLYVFFDLKPLSLSVERNIISERKIKFIVGPLGETQIIDEKKKVLVSYDKGNENFVSTIKGVILRNRSVTKKGSDSFVFLRLRSPKRLSIYDPVTNQEIDLAGFGKKNIEIFYELP